MKLSKGFTLLELMIVVAIIGILMTLGFGYFGDSVMRSNRSEGRAVLTETAGSLEKCKSLYGAYNHANCNVAMGFASGTNYYTVTGAINASSFTLTATPVAGGPQVRDLDCTTMTLTNTGVKAGTGAAPAECW